MTLYTFRIHFSDGTALDVTAENADEARVKAKLRKTREIQDGACLPANIAAAPLPRIEKTKLLREA